VYRPVRDGHSYRLIEIKRRTRSLLSSDSWTCGSTFSRSTTSGRSRGAGPSAGGSQARALRSPLLLPKRVSTTNKTAVTQRSTFGRAEKRQSSSRPSTTLPDRPRNWRFLPRPADDRREFEKAPIHFWIRSSWGIRRAEELGRVGARAAPPRHDSGISRGSFSLPVPLSIPLSGER